MPLMLHHLRSFFQDNNDKLSEITAALVVQEIDDTDDYDFKIQPGDNIYAALAQDMNTVVGHIKLLSTENLRTAIDVVFQAFDEEIRIALYHF